MHRRCHKIAIIKNWRTRSGNWVDFQAMNLKEDVLPFRSGFADKRGKENDGEGIKEKMYAGVLETFPAHSRLPNFAAKDVNKTTNTYPGPLCSISLHELPIRQRHEVDRRLWRHVVLLQLGQNVFPVCVLAQCGHVRAYAQHEYLPLTRFRDVDHLLYNVVGELVLHHGVQRAEGQREEFK